MYPRKLVLYDEMKCSYSAGGIIPTVDDVAADLVEESIDRFYVFVSTCLDDKLAVWLMILETLGKYCRYCSVRRQVALIADDDDE